MSKNKKYFIVFGIVVLAIGMLLIGCNSNPPEQPAQPGDAQTVNYPVKPITFVVPFAPGGSNDVATRGIQPYIQKYLGVPVLVENLSGSSGILGANKVYDSNNDGYVVLSLANTSMYRPKLMPDVTKFGDSMLESFIPVAAWMTGDANAIVVQKTSSINSLSILVEEAKDGLTIGIGGGIGSSDHASALVLIEAIGGDWTVVPYGGGAEVAAALLGGHIDVAMLGVAGAVDTSNFNLLAITSQERIKHYPDLPTFKELGYSDIDLSYVVGAAVPVGTPMEVVDILEDAIEKAFNDPDFQSWAEAAEVPIGQFFNREKFKAYLEEYTGNIDNILPIMIESMQQIQSGN